MIRIYHVPFTRSLRAIWVCEELGVPYEVQLMDFEHRKTPEWKEKNPVGKVPAMDDGDMTMFESGAMVQYVLDKYGEGRLQPAYGTAEHAAYLQWSWFAEATFARPLGEIVNHRREFDPELADVIAEMQGRAVICVEAINEVMTDREYICGEFSAADIMLGYSMLLSTRLSPWDGLPHAAAYWDRLQARPACQVAMKAGS